MAKHQAMSVPSENFVIREIHNSKKELQELTHMVLALSHHDGEKSTANALKLQKSIFVDKDLFVSLAYLDDEIVGFIAWCDTYSIHYGEKILYITGVYVKDSYRIKGYGTKLCDYIKLIAVKNGMRRIRWYIYGDNDKAQKFYDNQNAKIYRGYDIAEFELDTSLGMLSHD